MKIICYDVRWVPELFCVSSCRYPCLWVSKCNEIIWRTAGGCEFVVKTLERIQCTRETQLMTVRKIIPKDWNRLHSQGSCETTQWVPNKLKNVSEEATSVLASGLFVNFSCLSFYNTRVVDPGIASGYCYVIDSSLFSQ